jgi:hypothetical protein
MDGSPQHPEPRPEAHLYEICEAQRVRSAGTEACPIGAQSSRESPLVRFAEDGLARLGAPDAQWCVVVDRNVDACRALPELQEALSTRRQRIESEQQAAADARRAEEVAREDRRARDEAARRERAQAELTQRVAGCNLVGEGAFLGTGASTQRMWLCHGFRVLVEDGERVVYELANLSADTAVEGAQTASEAHLVFLTNPGRPDLLLEVEEPCFGGTVLAAWRGSVLRAVWSRHLDQGCGSGDEDVYYGGPLGDWWPPSLPPVAPQEQVMIVSDAPPMPEKKGILKFLKK